jgi:ATP-binding cassette subfamily F protein 3
MISIVNLSKRYGKRVLFENISLNINCKEKIGLIGPNGSGKSTLFSLILGEIEPEHGEVRVNKNTHIGYLPQEASFSPPDFQVTSGSPPEAQSSENTVLSELTRGDDRIIRLKKEQDELEAKNEAGTKRYGEVLHNLESLGFFELEYKAKKILGGLGFKERDFSRPIKQMSGGWQMRVLLAKLLTFSYDLLLLDEPTNYLDLYAALWLKDYLFSFKGTFIIISHDKVFLNEVTKYTLVLEQGIITKVSGNYEHYEEIKAERRKFLARQFKEQQKKKEQLERFISRFHAQPNKAAQVRAKRTALEKMEEIVVPPDPQESIRNFQFPKTYSSGHKVITLENISKSYGQINVYKDFDFELYRQEKAVLAGENGAGKSTLLKVLAGVIDIDSGTRKMGHNVEIGYFSQTRLDVLNPDNTVLEEAYLAAAGYMSETAIRTLLGAFLFTGDDVYKAVKVLSGGEKSRLILAKLLINPPNFLLLDEPTTHLDVDAVDALILALRQYQGSIVFISHDIHFVRSIANVVFEVKDGRIRKFSGGFDYYLEKKTQADAPPKEIQPKIKAQEKKADLDKEKKKEEERRLREEEKIRKVHNSAIRQEINKLGNKKEGLLLESYAKARALSNPKFYHYEEMAKEYGRRLKEINKIILKIEEKIKKLEGGLL